MSALSQLFMYAKLEQDELNEKLDSFYDVKSATNLNEKCKVCNKKLIDSLVVCLWCNKATHKQCVTTQCPYCTSDCYKHLKRL
jgi:hypothetical protein